ncbi:ORF14 [Ranid herpesvirus 1]|uniref:ORF14 n=1 Tax=Ranid herpesvirus 1 TaxID=85655 RepID=Q14VU4_9VIRU|nr:ORF14 [Ranid herpesvirus 1]ABG25750.1 ORF14 [Ranid herpesvirus 1]
MFLPICPTLSLLLGLVLSTDTLCPHDPPPKIAKCLIMPPGEQVFCMFNTVQDYDNVEWRQEDTIIARWTPKNGLYPVLLPRVSVVVNANHHSSLLHMREPLTFHNTKIGIFVKRGGTVLWQYVLHYKAEVGELRLTYQGEQYVLNCTSSAGHRIQWVKIPYGFEVRNTLLEGTRLPGPGQDNTAICALADRGEVNATLHLPELILQHTEPQITLEGDNSYTLTCSTPSCASYVTWYHKTHAYNATILKQVWESGQYVCKAWTKKGVMCGQGTVVISYLADGDNWIYCLMTYLVLCIVGLVLYCKHLTVRLVEVGTPGTGQADNADAIPNFVPAHQQQRNGSNIRKRNNVH